MGGEGKEGRSRERQLSAVRRAPMALSKGLRLLWKQEPGPSALLEARSRRDCLLLEAGTVAALSKCEKK